MATKKEPYQSEYFGQEIDAAIREVGDLDQRVSTLERNEFTPTPSQQMAINSGINSTLVSQISTNEASINHLTSDAEELQNRVATLEQNEFQPTPEQQEALDSGIDGPHVSLIDDNATRIEALEQSQFTPTSSQLAALNSGIDSTKVAQITVNQNEIDGLNKSTQPINLLKTQRYAALAAGVHVTPKNDGTYALGGTATGGTYFPYVGRMSDIPDSYVGQTLKLTGGVSDRLFLEVYNGSSAVYSDIGNGVTFTLTQEMLSYNIRLGVKKDTVCDNVVIRPMLCVDGAAASFVPYTPTNGELKEESSRFEVGRMKGTSYIAIGDSVTAYQGTTTTPYPTQNWVYGYIEAIEDNYGVVCTNLGQAGHKLIDDIGDLLQVSYENVSLVTIAYGMNEAKTSSPKGDTTDTYDANDPTFCGALNTLIEKIITDNAFCNVIVLSPNQRNVVNDFGSFTPNDNGDTLEDFANACVAVAAYRGVPCVDLFHTCGITAGNYSAMLKDGVHPSTSGYKRMYSAMRSTLLNLVMPKD